jgi:putative transposase
VNGRKRHIVVDTQGFLLRVVCHPADILDRVGAKLVLSQLKGYTQRLEVIFADGAYNGELRQWVARELACSLELVHPTIDPQTQQRRHPKRWVVERTFAWCGLYRRLNRDYEALPVLSEAFVTLAAINLLLHRLHPEC